MNVKTMTYKELEDKLTSNRCVLRRAKNLDVDRKLIKENHAIMAEMDRRWQQK